MEVSLIDFFTILGVIVFCI